MWMCRGGWWGGKKKIKWGSGVEVMTDVMCPFSSATRHLPEACGVFILLLDMLPSFSSVWINVPFYVARLIFIFSLSSLCPLCGMWSCAFRCTCMHITLKKKKRKLCSINLYFPCISVSAFLLALHQRLDGVTPHSLFFSLPPSSIAQYFSSVLRFDSLSTSPCHTPQFSIFPANTLPTPPLPL